MPKNTSITLGEHFEKIIQNSIATGRYASASEVIRAGLRKIDEEKQKIKLLREAIEAGEKSWYVKNFDSIKFLEKMHSNTQNENRIPTVTIEFPTYPRQLQFEKNLYINNAVLNKIIG